MLRGHTDRIFCVAMDDDIIVSGSADRTLRVWDRPSFSFVTSLVGHDGTVFAVAICGMHVVSSASDLEMRVWERSTWTCQHVVRHQHPFVRGLVFCGAPTDPKRRLQLEHGCPSRRASDEPPRGATRAIATSTTAPVPTRHATKETGALAHGSASSASSTAAAGGTAMEDGPNQGCSTRGFKEGRMPRWMVTGGSGPNPLNLWDARNFNYVDPLEAPDTPSDRGSDVYCLTSDGTRVMAGGQDRLVRVWGCVLQDVRQASSPPPASLWSTWGAAAPPALPQPSGPSHGVNHHLSSSASSPPNASHGNVGGGGMGGASPTESGSSPLNSSAAAASVSSNEYSYEWRCEATLEGHGDAVLALASDGDRWLASGSADGTMRLWWNQARGGEDGGVSGNSWCCEATLQIEPGAAIRGVGFTRSYVLALSSEMLCIWKRAPGWPVHMIVSVMCPSEGLYGALAIDDCSIVKDAGNCQLSVIDFALTSACSP
eukprot:jgi/Mesvir1/12326/Mv00516-RA.1